MCIGIGNIEKWEREKKKRKWETEAIANAQREKGEGRGERGSEGTERKDRVSETHPPHQQKDLLVRGWGCAVTCLQRGGKKKKREKEKAAQRTREEEEEEEAHNEQDSELVIEW